MKWLLPVLFCASLPLRADPKAYLNDRYLEKLEHRFSQSELGIYTTSDDESAFKSGFYEQTIDHTNPQTSPKFKQRYFLDSTYAQSKGSPVVLYICGEARCEASQLSGFTRNLAKENNAYLVALEHRYYGESQPFADLKTESLRFLTVDQAISDLVDFQKFALNQLGLKGKWLLIGGSYPGNLAAKARALLPNLFAGALASSAPVIAKEDFFEYDQHIAKMAGPTCLAAIQDVAQFADSAVKSPESFASLRAKFGATEVTDERDFLYLIADSAAAAVQYGMKSEFCSLISKETLALKVDGYAQFAKRLFMRWDIRPVEMTFAVAKDDAISSHSKGVGMRQWLYQSCREYGYFQVASSQKATSARSSRIDLAYHRDMCRQLFGFTTPVDTAKTNQKYLNKILSSGSKIFFSNGATDPWMTLGLTPEKLMQKNPALYSFVIVDAAHCDDLRSAKTTDNDSLKKSRQIFRDLSKIWLSDDV